MAIIFNLKSFYIDNFLESLPLCRTTEKLYPTPKGIFLFRIEEYFCEFKRS